MKTSTIAILLGATVSVAGITYVVSSKNDSSSPNEISSNSSNNSNAKTTSVTTASAQSKTTTTTPARKSPTSTSQNSTGKPADISDEAWANAKNQVKLITGFANQARESGWMQNMIKSAVERDAKSISAKLGLEGPNSEKIQKLLSDRIEKNTVKTRQIFDVMLNNEDGLATLLAAHEMREQNKEIPAGLKEATEARKKEMFGQFFKEGEEISDKAVMGLFGPERPQQWFKDDDFLVTASADLGESKGAELIDYAGKMDYLERQDTAQSTVNRIERGVDLQPKQSDALRKLYIDSPNPTDQQISQIVGADKLQDVKSSSTSRGRGWRR